MPLLLNTMVTADKYCSDICCDKFLVPQIDHKSKQVKEQWYKNFVSNQYGENLAILNTKNIVSSYLFTYLQLKYDTPVLPEYFSK